MCAELAKTNNFVTAGTNNEHETRAISLKCSNNSTMVAANLPFCGKVTIIVGDRWLNHGQLQIL